MSLLLCVVTIATWIQSYFMFYDLIWVHDFPTIGRLKRIRFQVISFRGGFAPSIIYIDAFNSSAIADLQTYYQWHPRGWETSSDTAQNVDDSSSRAQNPWRETYRFKPNSSSPLGFQFSSSHGRFQGRDFWTYAVAIPYWFPLLLFPIFPLLWLLRRRKYRISNAFCSQCGYDLRVTPDRCPECGTISQRITATVQPK